MLTPIVKPWSGVSRDFRLFRTEDKLAHGIFDKPVEQVHPTPGVIQIIVTLPEDGTLLASHVANRLAHIVESEDSHEWQGLKKVVLDAMDSLAGGHGLGGKEHHHVAFAHTGRFFAHPNHVPVDLFAEYLLTGKVSLHDSGGAVHVDDGRRKYTAYAQPGHAEESKKTLSHFFGHFAVAAKPLLDSLEGKILVA